MKALLLGIDGLSWNVLTPLLREGRLPHMGSFVDEGVSGCMDNLGESDSPVIWTTIATGKLPAEHQVTDFTCLFPKPGCLSQFLFRKMPFAGRKVMLKLGLAYESRVGSTQRQCKALWNMMSNMGKSVGLGCWWATYPAEPVNGFNISDQANYFRLKIKKDLGGVSLSEEELSGLERTVYPGVSRGTISSWHPLDEDGMLEFAARFTDLRGDVGRRFHEARTYRREEPLSVLKFSIYNNQFTLNSFEQMLSEHEDQPHFLAVYFSGVDGPSHAFWKYTFPEQFPSLPQGEKGFGEVLLRYYEWMDEVVGELLALVNQEETVTIVLSDHGFEAAGPEEARSGLSGTHDRAPNGVFLMGGAPVQSCKTVDARSIDIAPTVLHLTGLPVAQDMPGRVLSEALTPRFRSSHPLKEIPSYETECAPPAAGTAPRAPSSVDEAIKDHLKALGYFE